MQQQLEKRLKDLRPGALFTTRDGMTAVKSGSFNEEIECLVLATGQYIRLSGMTPVREVELEGQAVASEVEHEHTFTVAASNTFVTRMCSTCGMTWAFDTITKKDAQFFAHWYLIEELKEDTPEHEFHQELRRYPLLLDWLAELNRRVEDVRTLSMNKQVIRDTKREAQEASGWHVQKLGETMTVSLVFADYSLETRDFKQEGWQRLTEPEESPFHSTVKRTVERLERLFEKGGTITEHDIKESLTKLMPPKDKE
jgi:hypothetical protein